jgi:hypothetical protein
MRRLAIAVLLLAAAPAAHAGDDPAAVLELGAASSSSLTGGPSSFGPSLAVEFTPIEDRLEIEAGVTALLGRRSREFDADLLFKKPWTLSRKFEFMIGAGPEFIHSHEAGVSTNAPAAEFAVDLMYWPSSRHRFGLYVEPAADFSFGRGRERSAGLTAGLLIGIR